MFREKEISFGNVRLAQSKDIPNIKRLLIEGKKRGNVLERDEKEIQSVLDCFMVMEEGDSLIACASLEPYESPDPQKGIRGLSELRSVVSVKKGAGQRIVKARMHSAKGDVFTTTDNISKFKGYGFRDALGGNRILWMNFNRKKQTLFTPLLHGMEITGAETEDIKGILSLMSGEDILPMDRSELEYRLRSFYLYKRDGEIIGCVGGVVYPNPSDPDNPRMAEIRGLSVRHDYLSSDLETRLLDFVSKKFRDQHLKRAFITLMPYRQKKFLESGYFLEQWGGKSVLWWPGSGGVSKGMI